MVISIHGYHDASICIKDQGKYYIYEFERFANRRYAILTQQYPSVASTDDQFFRFFYYVKELHNIKSVDLCYYSEFGQDDLNKIKSIFNVREFKLFNHHKAHATSAFLQSNFEDAYIISYDGDGKNEDGSLSSFTAWKGRNTSVELIKDFQPYQANTLGGCYMSASTPIRSIKKNPDGICQGLSYSGKLMGLCAYGTPVEEWKPHFARFFSNGWIGEEVVLSNNIGVNIRERDCLTGQKELDYAATVQWGFEHRFFENFESLNIPVGSNICMSGGCSLNIKVNQMLLNKGYNVFVPPNPNDKK